VTDVMFYIILLYEIYLNLLEGLRKIAVKHVRLTSISTEIRTDDLRNRTSSVRNGKYG
jgi:hypothetical protein